MKCRDASKLLNYQEQSNYLYRNIQFHKPGQITFFLPPSVFLGGSGRQQEGTSLEELFTNAPVISLDLYLGGGRGTKEELLVFPCFFRAASVPEGPEALLFHCPLLDPSALHHSSYKNHVPSAPVAVPESTFIGKHAISFEVEKMKFPGDSTQCREFRENSLRRLFEGLENLGLLDW